MKIETIFQVPHHVPHWLHWTGVLQCAFRPEYTRGTTCRWQGRKAFPGAPLEIGKSDSEYTGISEIYFKIALISKYVLIVVKHWIKNTDLILTEKN